MDKKICHHQKKIIIKTFKVVASQYLFNIVILVNTVFYLKLNFNLKIDPKTCTFKNMEKISRKPVATL